MNFRNNKTVVMNMLIESLASTVSSESDDSDEEELLRHILYTPEVIKINSFVDGILRQYNDATFQNMFGINRSIANNLIAGYSVSSYSPKNRRGKEKISNEKAIILMLTYLRTHDSFRPIAKRFQVSISTSHTTLVRTLNYLLSQVNTYVTWPTSAEATRISHGFKELHGIEGILGALDTCHIKMNRPQEDGDSYKNMKGYHSMQVQGVVDHNKMFRDVYCGAGGSLFKYEVLQNSSIFTKCQDADMLEDRFLIGDYAYPCLPSLVTPYLDNGMLSDNQKIFNEKISGSRSVADQAFCLLKGRFPRLEYFLNSDVKFILKSVMCACVLHNICIAKGDSTEIPVRDRNDIVGEDIGLFLEVDNVEDEVKRDEIFRKLFAQ